MPGPSDTTLSANIKTNIPEEMRKAKGGFNDAASGAKNLEAGVTGAARQMAALEANTAKAAKAAQQAVFQQKLGAFAAGAGALGGALPSIMGNEQSFTSMFLQKGAGLAMGGAQIGGALGGPYGAGIGAAAGLGIAAWSAKSDSDRMTEERTKQLTDQLAALTEELRRAQMAQDKVGTGSSYYQILQDEIRDLSSAASKLRDQGAKQSEADKILKARLDDQSLQAIYAAVEKGSADGAERGTTSGSRASAVQLDVLKAEQLQNRSRIREFRGGM